jgi:hypothetical protein
VCSKRVFRRECLRDLASQQDIESAFDVDISKLLKLCIGLLCKLMRSFARSAASVSACELTETYSPAAIAVEPATKPATPATIRPPTMATPDKPAEPLRICEECDLEMVLLGKLPGVALRVAVRVFRCYVCNKVISEEM